MNKAKFMLLGIGVVGVVGGALAFKAQKFVGTKYCTVLTDTNCPASAEFIPSQPGGAAEQLHCTAASSSTCTSTITVVARID